MAEISLQEYCAEIRTLIKQEALDEAIAHCQHVLKSFPKFIGAYSLVAEASLGEVDYEGAADAFRRVLSADPEDMFAYIGLSMIYEEQGNIDEAVWNMERAFELSPEDMDVRKELQRLYSQRDGTDRSRVKLTPPALGRLYMKGALYQQAIDEFTPLFEQMPERLDIQLSLVEALWRAEKRRKAADIGQNLLDKAPDCLKANLILAEIWARAGDDERMQARLKVARELDPENRVAQELLKGKLPLKVEPVTLPKLVWTPPEEKEEEEIVDLEEISLEEVEGVEEPDWLAEMVSELVVEEPALEDEMAWLDEDKGFSLEFLDTGEVSEEVIAAMPPEDASIEELMAWMQRAQGGPPAAEPIPPEPEAPPPEPKPAPPTERPARRRGGALAVDEEEVSIAALESEMSVIEPEEVEISEEMRAQLESSMPPEGASPEEIMAWLQESREMVTGEAPAEAPEPEAVPAVELVPEAEEVFPEVPVEELIWEEEEIGLEAALGELAWEEEEVIGAEVPTVELAWEEEEGVEEAPPGELVWKEEEIVPEVLAEEPPVSELAWEEEEIPVEEAKEELVWEEEEVVAEVPVSELAWEEEEAVTEAPVGELVWEEEEAVAEVPVSELAWEEEEVVAEVPVSELVWEEAVTAEELEEKPAVEVTPPIDHTEQLLMAQTLWEQQKTAESLAQYGELISTAPELADTVVADLEQAYSEIPHELSIGYLLGEAYTRANRLEEALALYREMLANL